MESSLASLRKELKDWEHDFINIQNRSPTKGDIKANPLIQYKYKQYSKLKRIQSKKAPADKSHRVKSAHNVANVIRSPDVKKSTESNNALIEIGPTPQIYGKSISIFELNLSPVKKKLQIPQDIESEDETDLTKAGENDINDDGFDFRDDSPFMDFVPHLQPSGKAIMIPEVSRLEVKSIAESRYGPKSPLKFPADLSVKIRPHTPRSKPKMGITMEEDGSDSFVNTPPPLWKRSIGKSLRDLENEYIETSKNFVPMDEVTLKAISNDDNAETKDDNAETKDEIRDVDETVFTKGKKRKVRIRRFEDKTDKDNESRMNGVKINLHKQMHKLKKKQLRKIMKDLNMEDNTVLSESSSEEEEANVDMNTSKKKKQPRKKKYNLVSNNFRRLKLPTRKRNAFTKRFHRR
ncbi:DNA replication regulator sld2 [Maudiozyma exigua]|uniref:DNA replication regulator SLD2 n=1 Tax=Maudiozyma exigua TaxID=34358 RepID=A0A9P7B9M2_MAUEX|nr:DNA replication regulator sld2 [Kazachstania exigua]